jgi:hypothetical protein
MNDKEIKDNAPDHADADGFLAEVKLYSTEYNVSLEKAFRDVSDEYEQGAAEEADARRNGDWDYGRE